MVEAYEHVRLLDWPEDHINGYGRVVALAEDGLSVFVSNANMPYQGTLVYHEIPVDRVRSMKHDNAVEREQYCEEDLPVIEVRLEKLASALDAITETQIAHPVWSNDNRDLLVDVKEMLMSEMEHLVHAKMEIE